eukprot:Nk52_evm4s1967 gene=Nk52_evmTU4s1967
MVNQKKTLFGQVELDESPIPNECHQPLQNLVGPHVDSFNYMLEHGLGEAVKDLDKKRVVDANGNILTYWLGDVQVGVPMLPDKEQRSRNRFIFPSECRERGITYKAKLQVKLLWSVNDGEPMEMNRVIGQIPIMVRSDRCTLRGMSPKELISHHEEAEEMGGYFIINGNEKIVRMLIMPRRNYITAIIRPSFAKRGNLYTKYGCSVRGVRKDQTALTNTVHYLSNGSCTFRFSHRKQEYLIPAVLIFKALVDTNDKEIYENIVRRDYSNTFLTDRVELMLREGADLNITCKREALVYLGSRFKIMLDPGDFLSEEEIGREVLRKFCFVHLDDDRKKFDFLASTVQKLYKLVNSEIAADNPDSQMMQEVLTPGNFYLMVLKEKLDDWLGGVRTIIDYDKRRNPGSVSFKDNSFLAKTLQKNPIDIGRKMEYLMATGNLVSQTGLDLQQVSGYTIVADKLNFYRYLSHFRCIHRGAFFSEMKTTAVRKLLPEAWGFLCPVHTPDGAPCGLLNHLTHSCKVVDKPSFTGRVPKTLASLGMHPVSNTVVYPHDYLTVFLDGEVIGFCEPENAKDLAYKLRFLKVEGKDGLPETMEIGLIPPSSGGLFPGIYLFTTPARMVRPVEYLQTGKQELIGTFEQVYMDISVDDSEIYEGVTTHRETVKTNFLSLVANLTPFSDFNQSPRNMYQCQMGKQTMGTPCHALPYRTDNKLYRIQTPQSPIVRNKLYEDYKMDSYPLGTNAVVAVISYTGYDMEDAMILNKGAFERGFGHGSVYKSEIINLEKRRGRGEAGTLHFGTLPGTDKSIRGRLDVDGFPPVGTHLENGDPLYCVIDDVTGSQRIEKYKSLEPAILEEVRLLGSDTGDSEAQRAFLKMRINRNPIIGDKFSSRHGQKGVCSQKWPSQDMPFSENGIQPDIIINPHAFPSRMTIGMLVESLAGKSGALHGVRYDSTPFTFSEQERAVDYFGDHLNKAGFNYYGNERMYSGITGTELEADIFIGVVYYQRLRHMVSDKFQVRTTGPVHNLTHQPVKGRKRAGGIRFGEMERDSLLAHGTSYLLNDRLMKCSDYSHSYVCKTCGSIISPVVEHKQDISKKGVVTCTQCGNGNGIEIVAVPYVFRYLISELLAMNIKVNLDVK